MQSRRMCSLHLRVDPCQRAMSHSMLQSQFCIQPALLQSRNSAFHAKKVSQSLFWPFPHVAAEFQHCFHCWKVTLWCELLFSISFCSFSFNTIYSFRNMGIDLFKKLKQHSCEFITPSNSNTF